jgi:hypothetical protein
LKWRFAETSVFAHVLGVCTTPGKAAKVMLLMFRHLLRHANVHKTLKYYVAPMYSLAMFGGNQGKWGNRKMTMELIRFPVLAAKLSHPFRMQPGRRVPKLPFFFNSVSKALIVTLSLGDRLRIRARTNTYSGLMAVAFRNACVGP